MFLRSPLWGGVLCGPGVVPKGGACHRAEGGNKKLTTKDIKAMAEPMQEHWRTRQAVDQMTEVL